MKIEDKIKQELLQQQSQIEELVANEQGLFDMLFATFKGSLRGWVIAVNVVILVATAAMFYSLYQFFTVSEVKDLVFWGICSGLAMQMQVALKMWIYDEMRRVSLMKELKRVELLIAKSGD